ncbi:hypothetical protein IT568_06650 [bacterium]|nr:hypothetical protein [bacterium]
MNPLEELKNWHQNGILSKIFYDWLLKNLDVETWRLEEGESKEEKVDDFILQKILKGRLLDYLILVASSETVLIKELKTIFKQFLNNKARENNSEELQLYRKVKEILENPKFKIFKDLPDFRFKIFGLANWKNQEQKDFYYSEEKVKEIAYRSRLNYKFNSQINSPIISKEELENLIVEIFELTNSILNFEQIFNFIKTKITLLNHKIFSIDELNDQGTSFKENLADKEKFDFEEKEHAKDVSLQILNFLTDRQKQVLALVLKFNDQKNLTELGKLLNFSKSTIENEKKEIQKIVSKLSKNLSTETKMVLLENLHEKLLEIYKDFAFLEEKE